MPRRPCYWTRKLELELVEFVRKREFIWKSFGNTNHHIQQKYKAYAEFAAKLGRGFTARSVRDRWVNIRSTFNHNLRRVDKSKETATSASEVYIPCWPLWKPLQFLRDVSKKEDCNFETYPAETPNYRESLEVKDEMKSDTEETRTLNIRQRGHRTDRPRHKAISTSSVSNNQCTRILDDLIEAIKPLSNSVNSEDTVNYWFFGKHVTERLNSMRQEDAECASRDILTLLDDFLEPDVT